MFVSDKKGFLDSLAKKRVDPVFRSQVTNALLSSSALSVTGKYEEYYKSLPDFQKKMFSSRYGIGNGTDFANNVGLLPGVL